MTVLPSPPCTLFICIKTQKPVDIGRNSCSISVIASYTSLVQCYAHEDSSLWCTGRLKLNYTYVHIAQRDIGDKSRSTAVIIGFQYVRHTGAIRYYTLTLFAWMTKAMQAEMEQLGFPIVGKGHPLLYTPCTP